MSQPPPNKQKAFGDSSGEKKEAMPSRSPPRRRRGRSSRSRTRDTGERIIERVIERPSANVAWPMLTRTNYSEWALVMTVNFQTLRVWEIVRDGIDDDHDNDEYHDDRVAMAGILRSVPTELWSTLARKPMAMEAWETIKSLRIDDERACGASAQQLRREFNSISFKEGETVSEFGLRIDTLATNLRTLGDEITDSEVVKKLLQVVSESLNQAAVSIEMFMDLNTAKVEDVIGRLRVFEERSKPKQVTDAMGRLMLCEIQKTTA
ncbi:uncharacterized protein [Miscanthus floridulus]|uniref:uncharacterized protein n=1 Tax=Miscanthus floridulus TaxID=154761 RepID=UPI003458B040